MFDKLKQIHLKEKYGEIYPMQVSKDQYHEFTDPDKAGHWGKDIYNEWAKEYKKIMHAAKKSVNDSMFTSILECYLGYSYQQINAALRYNDQNIYYEDLSKLMKIIVCSAPATPEKIVVYRLVDNKFIDLLIQSNKKDPATPIQEKGFMSTGLLASSLIKQNDEPYSQFKNLLKIYVDEGTKGFYANVIDSRSEEEFVIYPDSYLRMIEYPYMNDGYIVYECELITFDH